MAVIGDFGFYKVIENSLPGYVRGWVLLPKTCPGGPSPYVPPAGFKITSCAYGQIDGKNAILLRCDALAMLCHPTETKCVGNDLWRCNASGSGWDYIGICNIPPPPTTSAGNFILIRTVQHVVLFEAWTAASDKTLNDMLRTLGVR